MVIKASTAESPRVAAEENSTVEAPADAPTMPSPSEADKRPEREADAERNVGAAKSNSPPWIETRPQAYRISVRICRIVSGHIHHIRISRLDVYVRPLLVNALLGRGPQIARVVSFVAHVLDRLHNVILLVLIGLAQLRGPRQIPVQVRQHRGKLHESLDAWIPILAVRFLGEIPSLQSWIRLYHPVRLYNLRWILRGGQYLRHERIGIQRNRSYQLMQLFRRQRCVLLLFRSHWGRRRLRVLVCTLILRRRGSDVLRRALVRRIVLVRVILWRGLFWRRGRIHLDAHARRG